jgi:peptide chain release factor 2
MRRLASLREEVEGWRELERRTRDALELAKLGFEEEELEAEVKSIAASLEEKERRLLFSGEHDYKNAILSIHAGAGGVDAQDWAEMLLRMYLRWAESKGFHTEILDTSYGEEAGIKSATIAVEGPYAYGYLKAEKGVHRLVRISPFDAAHRRHTSFALVEVLPDIEEEVEVEIKPEDLRIETFRSSGPGGQHMQKNATAVRIVHLPTGIVVSCQSERSQYYNKMAALRILKAKLYQKKMEEKAQEIAELKGERIEAGWGNQIRSYVLHPYKLVKDLRTGVEVTDPYRVLEGELDEFIMAYLRQSIQREGKKDARR